MSLSEIKTAIEQLSFEQRAELAAWLHGWNDDEWDKQMKRDIASGKFDDVLREVEQKILIRKPGTQEQSDVTNFYFPDLRKSA